MLGTSGAPNQGQQDHEPQRRGDDDPRHDRGHVLGELLLPAHHRVAHFVEKVAGLGEEALPFILRLRLGFNRLDRRLRGARVALQTWGRRTPSAVAPGCLRIVRGNRLRIRAATRCQHRSSKEKNGGHLPHGRLFYYVLRVQANSETQPAHSARDPDS